MRSKLREHAKVVSLLNKGTNDTAAGGWRETRYTSLRSGTTTTTAVRVQTITSIGSAILKKKNRQRKMTKRIENHHASKDEFVSQTEMELDVEFEPKNHIWKKERHME